MSVSNGWTLPLITVNCNSSGDTSALQAELDENNAFDTALASRVSNVETGLQAEESARKADVGSLISRVSNVETKNASQDISIAGQATSLSNTSVALLNRMTAVEAKNLSQDDSINNLSFQLQATQNSVSAISLVNTGDSFAPPGTAASLVHATSSNPSFKVKGLTASNSIVLGVSMDTVDISIDTALIGRISTLESKNTSQDSSLASLNTSIASLSTSIASLNTSISSIQSSIILNCTINGSPHIVGFQRVGSIVCMMVPAKSTTGSSIVIIFSTALPQIYRLSGSGSQSMSSFIMCTDNGVSKASGVDYSDDQGRITITTSNGFSGIGNLIMPVWSMTYSTALVV